MLPRRTHRGARPAAAVVELAVLLPLLMFFFVVGIDFSRVFYFSVTVTNAARNGAVYGSADAKHSQDATGIRDAALADATNISPAPGVASTTGVDLSGNPYVEVTVSYQFDGIVSYPGVPSAVQLSRTVRMRVGPDAPDEQTGQ